MPTLLSVRPPIEQLAALADETRWEVLTELAAGAASASALSARLPVSRQAIAKHLTVLESTGLVERVRAGREIRYQVLGAALSDVARQLDTIGRAWDRRLDRLAEHVRTHP